MPATATLPQIGLTSCPTRKRIEDYGMIGDCRAAALVSRDGSLDWLCWPHFDRAAVFAAILDHERGGYWRIAPACSCTSRRRYIPGTNLLETTFETPAGVVVLIDLMTVAGEFMKDPAALPDREIVRRVECARGEVPVQVEFWPRSDYGRGPVQVVQSGNLGFRVNCGNRQFWLRSSVAMQSDGEKAFCRPVLRAGEAVSFSLSYCTDAPALLPPMDDGLVRNRINISARWWSNWASHTQYEGEFREEVVRSALTLKMLSYAPTGAIVAAPTTSLPERLGDSLNWDYRYCWLRDASLTIRALLELGFWEEADDFMDRLLQATRLTQPELHVLYDVYGLPAPKERELDYLSGYENSRPVRVGNAARDQVQLDTYGEVIDAAAQYAFRGRPLDRDLQKALRGLGDYVLNNWDKPDQGIWEPRCRPENHTHSRLLCWVAMDRLINLHRVGKLGNAPVDKYQQAWEAIREQLARRAWNEGLQSYVSVLDGDELDASLLLMSWYGFDDASSQRMRATHRAIRRQLGASPSLLYRYRRDPPEGAFAICCFWEAEFLALGGGTLREAKALFRDLLRFQNDLGLYAEEIDPQTGAPLGNFPQAFTHIGLIGAALSIDQREKGEQQLGHRDDAANPQQAGPGGSS